MTIRLLSALPPIPPQYVVTFPSMIEDALVAAGLASLDLDDAQAFEPLPASIVQRPLMLVRITAAERAAPTAAMLLRTNVVYDDGVQWLQVNAAGDDLVPVAQPRNTAPRVLPERSGVVTAAVQFRGAADSAASLGTLGLCINAANDAAAAALLAGSVPTVTSTVNGAATDGAWRSIVSAVPITSVHVGQIGMAGSYALQTAGPCSAASYEYTRLDFDVADGITSLQWLESGPTNYAGTAGTGSARQVMLIGIAES